MRNVYFSILIFLSAISFTACSDMERKITVDQLPESAKTFLSQNFPEKTIKKAEKEGAKFEIELIDGTDVDFDKNGNWTKVDMKKGERVPSQIIPEAIASYVAENHPDAFINEIDIERRGYHVDLSNGYDLLFDKQGVLKKIDD